MPDDPNKTAEDRRTISSQPFERSQAREVLRQKFPEAAPEAVTEALEAATEEVAPSEGRDKIIGRACELLLA
ncbi:MAG: hypothetical protein ACR2OZ_00010 [Verrucomicrobiales bacterium]